MKIPAALLLLLLLAAAGCKRAEPEQPSEEKLQQSVREAYRIQGEAGLQALRAGIGNFQQTQGRNPSSLEELVESKVMNEMPAAPPGSSYSYNIETGEVSLVGGGGSANTTTAGEITSEQALEAALTAKSKADLKKVRVAINVYLTEEGKYPTTLEDLVQRKLLDALPTPPSGMKYNYNPESGKVDVAPKE
jgi:hypothetical protein